jgi:hypothetical protein
MDFNDATNQLRMKYVVPEPKSDRIKGGDLLRGHANLSRSLQMITIMAKIASQPSKWGSQILWIGMEGGIGR